MAAEQKMNNNNKVVEEQKSDSSSMITAISWTGGKDCNLALLKTYRDPRFNVQYLVSFRLSTKPSQAHPVAFMKAQAESLQLQLLFVDFEEGTTDYKKAYVDGIQRLSNEYNIQVIVTGDMDYVGTSTTNWMTDCCKQAGNIQCHLPLWNINREDALNEMLAAQFEIVFSCVKEPFFDATWINRRLDRKALGEMKTMIQQGLTPQQIEAGIQILDLAGERGEYHTMCINGPLYHHKVTVEVNDEPHEEIIENGKGSNWKGNIHNAKRLWLISLK